MNNEQNGISKSAPIEPSEGNKWELDTSVWLNKVYHELLGESIDAGSWTRDISKQRFMNEIGVSAFMQEVNARVSIHSSLSELSDVEIIDISSTGAEIFANRLVENYALWEVAPREANLESISQQLYDILFILLKNAKKGGMRRHRENIKSPKFISPNIPPDKQGLGAY